MPRVSSPSPRRASSRSRRGRSPGRGDSKKRSESPMFGEPTPTARGGRSRLSVVQNRTPSRHTSEIERLQFNSPGPKMNGLDSPTPRAARSRSRGRTAPPTPAPIIEETSPQRPSVSPSRGSHRGRACTSTSSEDERATATTPSRSPLRRVPSPQRAAAAAAAATEGGTAANEAPVCNYL